MILRIILISVAFLCALFQPSTCTTCSERTQNTCKKTRFVSGVCSSTMCACVDGYTPVETGCASVSSVPRPELTAQVEHYSGEVYVTEDTKGELTLKCHKSLEADVEYRWYLNNGLIDGVTGMQYIVEGITQDDVMVFRCKILAGDLQSPMSPPFTVKGYSDQGAITERPVVLGMPDRIQAGANLRLHCANIPKDTNVQFQWDNSLKSPGQILVEKEISASSSLVSRSCMLTREAPVTIINAQSDPVIGYVKPLTDFDIDMVQGSGPVIIAMNQANYILECQVRGTHALRSGIPSWKWKANGETVRGAILPAFSVPTNQEGEVTYECEANFGEGVIKSVFKEVTVSDSVLAESHVVAIPGQPIIAGYLQLRCLIRAQTDADVRFHWRHNDNVIVGQEDHTIQMNELTTRLHSGKYGCTAMKGDARAISRDTTVEIKNLPDGYATISPDRDMYGRGTLYTFTCMTTSDGPGITYEWHRDGMVVGTKKTFSMRATSIAVEILCRVRFGDWDLKSSAIIVQGKNLLGVSVHGPTSPVLGTWASLLCTVEKGDSSPDPTYHWFRDDEEIIGETEKMLIFRDVTADHAKHYKCRVRIGTEEMDSETLKLQPAEKPATPRITSSALELHKSGTYHLTCHSDSEENGTEFEWWKYKEGNTGDLELISTTATNVYTITKPTRAIEEGDIVCRITIGDKRSAISDPIHLTYFDRKGKRCFSISHCIASTDWWLYYTGHCINEVCQCAPGVDTTPDACGASPSITRSQQTVVYIFLSILVSAASSWI